MLAVFYRVLPHAYALRLPRVYSLLVLRFYCFYRFYVNQLNVPCIPGAQELNNNKQRRQ